MISARTVLVVDAREDAVLLLRSIFENAKVLNNVQWVGTAQDALAYLKGDGIYAYRKTYPFPILVLLDLQLPDGSAIDVLRWVRANPRMAPSAIVLTAPDFHTARKSDERCEYPFLVKPLKFEEFEKVVSRIPGIKLSLVEGGQILESSSSSAAPE